MNKQVKRKMRVFDEVMGEMRNQPLGKYSNISFTDNARKRVRKHKSKEK